MSGLRIGTCSWKYDSWRGLVYSENPKINYLKEYSEKYNTVEVDQWFWSLSSGKNISLPKTDDVAAYNHSVPDNFKFTLKMPNSLTLTHHYRKKKSDSLITNKYFLSQEVLALSLENLSGMKEKLGPLMFQFEYLNKEKMLSQEEFLNKLENFFLSAPKDYSYGIEIRNPNYLNINFFEFIARNHLVLVFLEGYFMPDIVGLYEKYGDLIRNTVVIRLHGPDRTGIEKITKGEWNKIVDPKDEQLKNIAAVIRDLQKRKVDIYLNVNNHFEGSAPLTIRKILKMI